MNISQWVHKVVEEHVTPHNSNMVAAIAASLKNCLLEHFLLQACRKQLDSYRINESKLWIKIKQAIGLAIGFIKWVYKITGFSYHCHQTILQFADQLSSSIDDTCRCKALGFEELWI